MDQHLSHSNAQGALRVFNTTTFPARYEITVDRLSVDASGDQVATPTTDLAFYPASVFELAPGQAQTIRWRRTSSDATSELVYKVEVSEDIQNDGPATSLLTMKPRARLVWNFTSSGALPVLKAQATGAGTVLRNDGAALARIRSATVGGITSEPFRFLPGQRMTLPAGTTVRVDVQGDVQTLTVE